jgi:selenium metabolism protein YedF
VHNSKKIIYLKSDKVGEGELGSMLAKGFLNAINEQENLPKSIICINSAVLLTTADKSNDIMQILKNLEKKGVNIYSCGTCLDFYNKRNDLKVGVVGNAKETVKMLLESDVITL